MASNRTPAYKRIKRAEGGRDSWKMKAIERREENEKLKTEAQDREAVISALEEKNTNLSNELEETNKKLVHIQTEIEIKKKSNVRWRETVPSSVLRSSYKTRS